MDSDSNNIPYVGVRENTKTRVYVRLRQLNRGQNLLFRLRILTADERTVSQFKELIVVHCKTRYSKTHFL